MFAARDKIPMRTVTVLPLLLIPLSFTSLTGQDTLTAGDKVRVTTDKERVVGYLTAIEGEQLTLDTTFRRLDTSLVLPLASVTKFEVSRGQNSKAGMGALVGLIVGAGVGAAFGIGLCNSFPQDDNCVGDGVVGGLLLALPTAGLGALIGLTIKVERWKTVPLDRIRVGLIPRGGGLEVSAKFVF